MAAQTLSAEDFEIVVVHNELTATTPAVVEEFQGRHPSHRTRLLDARASSVGSLRAIGLEAARGEFVSFVDDDDRVSPRYLELLLEAAGPGIVSAATMAEVDEDSDHREPPSPDARERGALGAMVGQVGEPHELLADDSCSTGKLLRTDLARGIRYEARLRSGDEHLFWLQLLARKHQRFRLLRANEGAVYLRTVRKSRIDNPATTYDSDVTQRLELLRAIEDVDRSDPAVARVARGLALYQASWLNSYLQSHPDDHARLAQDVRAMALREFPWQAVNAGLARDLAICYCFPPDLDTSGMVAARRLRERGVVVDVISKNLSSLRTVDPEALRVPAEVLGNTHTVGGVASFVRWAATAAFAEETWATVETWESTQGPYRSVYSRAMAPQSHFAAALVKLRRPEVEWVAEFSDPLRINAVGEERIGQVSDDWLSRELFAGLAEAGLEQPVDLEIFDLAERIAYALADRVVFTNNHQMEYMLGYCSDRRLADRVRGISEVCRHPTLPPDFYEMATTDLVLDPTKVHVAYFGVFYSTRGLGEVLQALSRLGHMERDRVRLHVFTPHPDVMTLEVIRAGLAGVVLPRPFVGFLEFLHLTTKFDVLLVNDAATEAHSGINPYLPSKVSDYQGSGRPVWAVYEEGSVLSTLPFDYRSPLGDVDGALAVLGRLVAPESSGAAAS